MIGWVTAVRTGTTFGQVATELGLKSRRGRGWSPCPACGAAARGHDDSRGPVGEADGKGWRCHLCGAGGSVVDLVAHAVSADPCGPEVRAWFAARGWCRPAPGAKPPPRVTPKPPPAPPPELEPLPAGEASALWERCGSVLDAPDVAGWLRGRGLSPTDVDDRDLARVLPSGGLPAWAAHWPGLGVGCVLPLVGPGGELAGLQGRRTSMAHGPKSVAMRGVRSRGLLLADAVGRAMFRGELEPGSHVLVAEGEPDWLTFASTFNVSDSPAVLGIPGGGRWTPELGARVPNGAVVVVATHLDDAGDRFASDVYQTLRGRCRVLRRRWAA